MKNENANNTGQMKPVVILLNFIHGDGKKLINFIPLATRPNYYQVRIDSGFDLDEMSDSGLLEEIYNAIEDQFGRGDDPDDESIDEPFPALHADCGASWGEV